MKSIEQLCTEVEEKIRPSTLGELSPGAMKRLATEAAEGAIPAIDLTKSQDDRAMVVVLVVAVVGGIIGANVIPVAVLGAILGFIIAGITAFFIGCSFVARMEKNPALIRQREAEVVAKAEQILSALELRAAPQRREAEVAAAVEREAQEQQKAQEAEQRRAAAEEARHQKLIDAVTAEQSQSLF